jgi:hypothetical protein
VSLRDLQALARVREFDDVLIDGNEVGGFARFDRSSLLIKVQITRTVDGVSVYGVLDANALRRCNGLLVRELTRDRRCDIDEGLRIPGIDRRVRTGDEGGARVPHRLEGVHSSLVVPAGWMKRGVVVPNHPVDERYDQQVVFRIEISPREGTSKIEVIPAHARHIVRIYDKLTFRRACGICRIRR